jgi:exopolyphosphatase/guanosine-5'-triphosphate,3'-diphosphate pyrophosphatase
MDLGGGSLELAYYENSVLKGVTTLPLGAVRLLSKGQSVHALCDHIAAVSEKDTFLWKFIQHTPKDLYVVGSGGNIRALYRLRKRILHKELSKIPVLSLRDLTTIIQKLEKKSPKQREKDFKLAKDRADVIVPAGYVFHQILHYLGAQEIHVPFSVSLRQGTLIDLQRDLYT